MSSPILSPRTQLLRSEGKLLVRHGDQVRSVAGDEAVALVRTLVAGATGSILLEPAGGGAAWAQLVGVLEEIGLVTTDVDVTTASPQARQLWDRAGRVLPVGDIDAALRGAVIPVIGTGPVAERIRAVIAGAGVALTQDRAAGRASAQIPGALPVTVVVGESIDDPALLAHNEWAHEHRAPWLPVIPDDAHRAIVGPYLVPGSSACFACYRLRRLANFPDRRIIDALTQATAIPMTTPATALLGMDWFIAGLVAEKVLERAALGDHSAMSAPGSLASLEPARPGIDVSEHRVLRVPRCPTCSPTKDRGMPQVWFHGGERP